MNMRLGAGFALVISLFALPSWADVPGAQRHPLLKKQVTLPSNTFETQVIHVNFAPGYKTPLHTHEGPGPRYIVKGQLRVVDAKENRVYSTGEVFWETGAAMTIENISQDNAEVVIFQVAPIKH